MDPKRKVMGDYGDTPMKRTLTNNSNKNSQTLVNWVNERDY